MAIVLRKARNIVTESFEGVDAKLSLIDVIGELEEAPFTVGICEISASDPVAFAQDDNAVACLMLEGHVTISEGDVQLDFEPGDIVFLPQRDGLVITWDTSSYGKWLYVMSPHRR